MRRTIELRYAIAFLTRLPIGLDKAAAMVPLARAVWAFPLVGAGLGLASGLVYAAGRSLTLSPMIAATLAVAALVLMTGALHEDGLADVADGLGGGTTRERKLDIMRDSRIGSYGVIALVLALLARIATLAQIDDTGTVVAAIVAAEAVSRGWLGPIMATARPARADGLAAGAGQPSRRGAGAAIVLASLVLFFMGIAAIGLPGALLAFVLSGAAAALLARFAQRRLGGITGDVLGACQQLATVVFLAVVAATT